MMRIIIQANIKMWHTFFLDSQTDIKKLVLAKAVPKVKLNERQRKLKAKLQKLKKKLYHIKISNM